jgi:O-methyltransferase involved in polyketide biosynthesis
MSFTVILAMTRVISLESSVLETYIDRIYLPLYARAFETLRSDALFQDESALQLFKALNIDMSKTALGSVALLGCVLRSQLFDTLVQEFLSQYPRCSVLNIGAGLCTRFARLSPMGVDWYDIDVPEVIKIRQQVTVPPAKVLHALEGKHYQTLAAKVWDVGSSAALPASTESPVLVILEGVSMYLTNQQTRQMLWNLRDRYSNVHVLMDVIHHKFVDATQEMTKALNPSMQFCGGLENFSDLLSWEVGITSLQRHNYLTQLIDYPERLEPWMTHFLPILKSLLADSACITTFNLASQKF